MPILDSFTLVFFSPIILICVCTLLNAELDWEDSNQEKTQDLIPLRLLLQARHVPKHPNITSFPLKRNNLILAPGDGKVLCDSILHILMYVLLLKLFNYSSSIQRVC